MPRSGSITTSFMAGEISQLTESRIEIPQYQYSCRTLENVFVLPMGGAQGRPGTKFVGAAQDTDKVSNLIPYVRADGTAYILSVGRTHIWIYKDGARVGTVAKALSDAGVTLDNDTEVLELHFAQINDVVYITPNNLSDLTNGVANMFSVAYDGGTDTNAGSWTVAVVNFLQSSGSGSPVYGSGDYNDAQARWPSVVTVHEQRLIVGGDKEKPSRVIGSKTNTPVEHDIVDNDNITASDPWQYEVQGTAARALLSWTGLLYFSLESEWSFGTNVIAPTALPLLKRQSQNGASRVQPVLMQNTGAFVQGGGKVVREILFSNDLQAYTATDLTALNPDITGATGLQDMVFQTNPNSVLWCLRKDGQLACLNIQEDGSKAWTRIITNSGDAFESICTVRKGAEDQVWVCVKRVVNGSTKRYIEYFNTRDYGTDEADAVFVDSALTWDGGADKTITGITGANPGVIESVGHGLSTDDYVRLAGIAGMVEVNSLDTGNGEGVFKITKVDNDEFKLQAGAGFVNTSAFTTYSSGGTITEVIKTIATGTTLTAGEGTTTGLSHLEAASLAILADGGVHAPKTVSSGAITLDGFFNTVHMGLGYNQNVQPVPMESVETAGLTKNIEKCSIKVYKTQEGIQIGPDEDTLKNVIFRVTKDAMSEPLTPFTGMFTQTIDGKTDKLVSVYLRNPNPTPMTVLGIRSTVKVNDI